MDARYKAEVVKYFREKGTTGFEPITYLGAEQRFVGPLRNSSVNNLEEQYLLGTDSYIEIYIDSDGNTVTERSFHKNDGDHANATNYYKIVSYVYKEGIVAEDTDYHFEKDTFYSPYVPNDVKYGDGSLEFPDNNTLYMINNAIFKVDSVDISKIKIEPPYVTTVQRDRLYFVAPALTTLLLTKDVKVKEVEENGVKKKIIYEVVTNHLL